MSVTASIECYKRNGEEVEKGGEILNLLLFARTVYMSVVKRHSFVGKPALRFPNIAIRRDKERDSN